MPVHVNILEKDTLNFRLLVTDSVINESILYAEHTLLLKY